MAGNGYANAVVGAETACGRFVRGVVKNVAPAVAACAVRRSDNHAKKDGSASVPARA